jgi:hypothetical protein
MSATKRRIEDVLDTYRRCYPRWNDLEGEIQIALKLYETHNRKELRDLWREGQIRTLTRDIASDLNDLFITPSG